jgi:RNA polymerase sigma-70 factor (ECF subfamily)
MIEADDIDDQGIVEKVVLGQKELFRLLVQRHQRGIYSLGMSFFRHPEDAADFTQEVFLKAFKSLATFRGQARFSTWLFRIAYNTAINGIQRRKDFHSLAEDAEIPDTDTPERRAMRRVVRDSVGKALEELPERYRVCVDLYFFYDQTYAEIGAVTGLPINTIKSHVFRAKKILREKLRDTMEGGIE